MEKIIYSAVVLDEASHIKLELLLEREYPDAYKNWKLYAHHMTICMGELPENLKEKIGTTVKLEVIAIGDTDKAIAVKVNGFYSKNKNPHVTLAVNIKRGGKPVMSNEITNWTPFHGYTLTGTVKELTN